jgi:hypothetical protein
MHPALCIHDKPTIAADRELRAVGPGKDTPSPSRIIRTALFRRSAAAPLTIRDTTAYGLSTPPEGHFESTASCMRHLFPLLNHAGIAFEDGGVTIKCWYTTLFIVIVAPNQLPSDFALGMDRGTERLSLAIWSMAPRYLLNVEVPVQVVQLGQ